MRTGVYPGSFNPPTVAHLAVAEAARDQRDLDQVTFVLSRVALGKERDRVPTVEQRRAVLAASVVDLSWADVAVTTDQLLVDIAAGFDCVIMGADKWLQIHDVSYYASEEERDRAVAALPDPALFPRLGLTIPAELELAIDPALADVSSTGARAGHTAWMPDAAIRSGLWT